MKRSFKKVFILAAIASLSHVFAQSKAADKLYDNYLYSEYIYRCEGIGSKNENVNRKLAESYRLTSDPANAEKYYEKLFSMGNVTADDVWHYAEVLKMNAKYTDALSKMSQYLTMQPGSKKAELHLADNIYYDKLIADNDRFAVKALSSNTSQSEYAPAYYNAQIVFVSSKPIYTFTEYIDDWTARRYTNLFSSYDVRDKKGNPALQSVREVIIRTGLPRKYHVGPASFSADGMTMIFTRNNYNKKKELNSNSERMLELWMSKLDVDGTWRPPVALPFNSLEYNVGHPAISPDGKTLYFVSDMPGGFGGNDIYRCTMTADGVFGPPVNMGDEINTDGDEVYPFIHEKGVLFFASSGHPGLGGLDIFYTKLNADFSPGRIRNCGGSLNTSMDDYSLIMDISMKRGFFASNRGGGKGSDDIYTFDVLKPFTFNKTIAGTVTDKETGDPIPNAFVKLTNTNNEIIGEVVTDATGGFTFDAEPNKDFDVAGSADNYKGSNKKVSTNTEADMVTVDLKLERMLAISIACLITDNKTGKPLDSVKIIINDKFTGNKLFEGYSNSDGKWREVLPKTMMNTNISYVIKLNKQGYMEKTIEWSYRIYKEEEIRMHEFMDFNMGMLEIGIDLGKLLGLKPIYYDRGKWNIKEESKIELDKIVAAMMIYRDIVIELDSHTDCRDAADKNLTLSQKRAESAVAYIVSRGIPQDRISARGMGETKLINGCACEGTVKSDCSEADHAANRRTEFLVVGFKQ